MSRASGFHHVFGHDAPGGYNAGPKQSEAPSAPTQDTAANSARNQQDFLRQRKGVLANIFAGSAQSAPAPTVATKTLLGS